MTPAVQPPRRSRLFVAAELDAATRAACEEAALRLRDAAFRGRWVPPENYHLTVAFLGSVEAQRCSAVARAVRDAATRVAPFDVVVDAVGGFPNRRAPRVVWAGPHADVAPFRSLCSTVRQPLEALGFRFEPRFEAHVTLARADGGMALPQLDAVSAATLRVEAVALFESFTAAGGVRYEMRERFGLA